jgi:hypothetical protein
MIALWALLAGCDATGFETGETGLEIPATIPESKGGTVVTTDGVAWDEVGGPCDGYRTETLVFDEDDSAWAGCGADQGMYFARTPGAWESIPALSQFHGYDAQLADNGVLYLAGDDTASDVIAWTADPSDQADIDPVALLRFDGTVDGIPLAGGIARTGAGKIVVDAQNANSYAVSTNDGDSFTAEYLDSYQMLDIDVGNGAIYGAGSTIAQPPTMMFPKEDDTFDTISLPGGFTGELFGLAAIGTNTFVAVGADEQAHTGILARCFASCEQRASWEVFSLATSNLVGAPEYAGRMMAVCFDSAGTNGIAVGEKFPPGLGGFAIYSRDGGHNWNEAGNPNFPLLSECWAFDDGRFAVAGGAGYLAIGSGLP